MHPSPNVSLESLPILSPHTGISRPATPLLVKLARASHALCIKIEKAVTACHCSPALLIDTRRSDGKKCGVESSVLGIHELALEPECEWDLETSVRAGYNGK